MSTEKPVKDLSHHNFVEAYCHAVGRGDDVPFRNDVYIQYWRLYGDWTRQQGARLEVAMHVLPGILAHPNHIHTKLDATTRAVEHADALLAEIERTGARGE